MPRKVGVRVLMIYGDYLSNPYGALGNAALSAMFKQFTEQQLKDDYPRGITYDIFSIEKDHQVVVHAHLSSRTKQGVTYDVLFQIDLSSLEAGQKIGFAKLPIKVFSNSPSFYYTFAKVFEERGAFCTWLKSKYERKIMRKEPEVRNPTRIIGYERTVYTCLTDFLQTHRNINAIELYNRGKKTSYREIARGVQSQEDIERQYDKAPYLPAIAKKKEEAAKRREEQRAARQVTAPRRPNTSNTSIKSSSKSKTTSKTSTSKKSGLISRIKKIGKKR